jgi:hypothetical protein
LWARQAWGTWWEWDPRLTTSFILWVIYSGILLARSSLEDPHRRARTGAVLAILGTLDIPLVVMATRWFRGLHPVSPDMEPSMRITLLIGVAAWTLFFVWLTHRRRVQVGWNIWPATCSGRATNGAQARRMEMGTLAAGYGVVCLAVVVYVAWLGHRQRRLVKQYESLRDELQTRDAETCFASRVRAPPVDGKVRLKAPRRKRSHRAMLVRCDGLAPVHGIVLQRKRRSLRCWSLWCIGGLPDRRGRVRGWRRLDPRSGRQSLRKRSAGTRDRGDPAGPLGRRVRRCGATQSDDEGRFAFAGLPLDEDLIYLPGANLDGIHYPGPRLRLNRRQPARRSNWRSARRSPSPIRWSSAATRS